MQSHNIQQFLWNKKGKTVWNMKMWIVQYRNNFVKKKNKPVIDNQYRSPNIQWFPQENETIVSTKADFHLLMANDIYQKVRSNLLSITRYYYPNIQRFLSKRKKNLSSMPWFNPFLFSRSNVENIVLNSWHRFINMEWSTSRGEKTLSSMIQYQ